MNNYLKLYVYTLIVFISFIVLGCIFRAIEIIFVSFIGAYLSAFAIESEYKENNSSKNNS